MTVVSAGDETKTRRQQHDLPSLTTPTRENPMTETKPGPPATRFYRLPQLSRHRSPTYWGTWLALALLRACAWLPFFVSRRLGTVLGLMMLGLNAKRREIARINIDFCFLDLSEAERARLLRRHFAVTGQSFVDMAHLAWSSRRRLKKKTRINGLEHLRTEIEAGRPVILLAPHCVGMSFGGSLVAEGIDMFSMIKQQRNPLLNWFLNKGRMRFGCRLLLRDQGLRPVIRNLQRGQVFYYLPDEDFGPDHSVFAPFFGIQTATLTVPSRLARLTGAVVMPCFTRLLPGGRGYEVTIAPPLANLPSGDHIDDAATINAAFEAAIRNMPEQYLWTFKIFKTRPGNAPSPYD